MYFLLFIFLLIVCLVFIELKIYIDYTIENSYNLLKARIRFFNIPFLAFTLKFTIIKEKDGDYVFYLLKRKNKKPLTSAAKLYKREGKVKKFLLKTNLWEFTSIKEIALRADIGTGDAASTAILSGALQTLVLTVLNFLHFRDRENMHAQVKFAPVYEKKIFNATIKCILGIKIAHIISTLSKKYIFKRS